MKKTTKKQGKPRRGLAPKKSAIAEAHRRGYGTPAEVARKFGVSAASVYGWARDKKLEEVDGQPASLKVGANLWVLFASVAKKTAFPASA